MISGEAQLTVYEVSDVVGALGILIFVIVHVITRETASKVKGGRIRGVCVIVRVCVLI